MQHSTRRLGLVAAVTIAFGAGLAGTAVAAPIEAQAPANDNHAEDRMQQMDPAMEQCVDAMPADMRDEARQMHRQMRPMMQQMMSGADGMGGMDRKGDSGMGGMEDGSGMHSGDADSGDEPRDSDG